MKFFVAIIFFISSSYLTAENYTINLVFINKAYRDINEGDYVFGAGANKEEKKQDFTLRLVDRSISWAMNNPYAKVNIWIDNEFLAPEILLNTKRLLEERIQSTDPDINSKIFIKNIRDIPLVQENFRIFGDKNALPKVPVYMRADLARAIIAHDSLTSNPKIVFVYADLDINPQDLQKEIENNQDLIDYGYLMAQQTLKNKQYENSFFIMTSKKDFLKAHKYQVIDRGIKTAYDVLDNNKDFYEGIIWGYYGHITKTIKELRYIALKTLIDSIPIDSEFNNIKIDYESLEWKNIFKELKERVPLYYIKGSDELRKPFF